MRGLERLSVRDASVMPSIVSGQHQDQPESSSWIVGMDDMRKGVPDDCNGDRPARRRLTRCVAPGAGTRLARSRGALSRAAAASFGTNGPYQTLGAARPVAARRVRARPGKTLASLQWSRSVGRQGRGALESRSPSAGRPAGYGLPAPRPQRCDRRRAAWPLPRHTAGSDPLFVAAPMIGPYFRNNLPRQV